MEREPTESQKSLIREATCLRGRIVTSYSQVEFLLADLSVKLDLNFPYRIKDRIKAAKRIGERPEFAAYKADIEVVCEELLEFEEVRHLMAHGYMQLTTDRKGNHEFEFRLYQRENKDQLNQLVVTTTVPRMRETAEMITRYVQHAVGVFRRIYLEKGVRET